MNRIFAACIALAGLAAPALPQELVSEADADKAVEALLAAETPRTASPPPPVKVGLNGERIVRQAVFDNARIEQVLFTIGQQAGVTITPLGTVPGSRTTLAERDIELETLLDRIAQPRGWIWYKQGDGNYGLADEAWYKRSVLPGHPPQRIIRTEHVLPSRIEKALESMLTPGISSIVVDDRTRKIIVIDDPDTLDRVCAMAKGLDVEIQTDEWRQRISAMEERSGRMQTAREGAVVAAEPGVVAILEAERTRTASPAGQMLVSGTWSEASAEAFFEDVFARISIHATEGLVPMQASPVVVARGSAATRTVTLSTRNESAVSLASRVLHDNGWLMRRDSASGALLVGDPASHERHSLEGAIATCDIAVDHAALDEIAARMRDRADGCALVALDAERSVVSIRGFGQKVRELEEQAETVAGVGR